MPHVFAASIIGAGKKCLIQSDINENPLDYVLWVHSEFEVNACTECCLRISLYKIYVWDY